MVRPLVLSFFILFALEGGGQIKYDMTGTVKDRFTKEVVKRARVGWDVQFVVPDPIDGKFILSGLAPKQYIITVSAPNYISMHIPVALRDGNVDLGTLYLERDITYEESDNLITLTEADLMEEEIGPISSEMLQAGRDVFLNRAAFDFGQAFFRIRGYGSEYGQVLLNGVPMDKFVNGRAQWSNWGGLNDVFRNKEFANGLQASDHGFGGILGTTYIDTRPSLMRKGLRLSSSFSNRTYTGRLMGTYVSGSAQDKLSFALSASRRWAGEGYIQGTLYDAYSFFGSIEYAVDDKNSLMLSAILASNRRGRSAAITQEVFQILGSRYNPYWGHQDGKIRNARVRKNREPIWMLNHFHNSGRLQLNTAIAFQSGTDANSRLGYYNAPNPDPTYYRYMPSYYINSPIGSNFVSADMAGQGLLKDSRINWGRLYQANSPASLNGRASYLLYDDIAEETQFWVDSQINYRIAQWVKLRLGGMYRSSNTDYYAEVTDLLGADFHMDIDPFTNTENDVAGSVHKLVGDRFNYFYRIDSNRKNGFFQLHLNRSKWEGFAAVDYTVTAYQREGFYRNGRFLDNSLGKGREVEFSSFGAKGGFTYRLSGRHWIGLNGALLMEPPAHRNIFINPRENNRIVPGIGNGKINTLDINYYLWLPKLTGRLTGYYTRFQNTTDINFFYVDAGIGSDFVQEVVTGLDKVHMGTELGLEYRISPTVKLSWVAAMGKFLYASDPHVTINFDTVGTGEDNRIGTEGSLELGVSKIKDHKLAQGPQKAFALGAEYRDPKYWWVGATANYLGNNYTGISTITRTASFYLDPDTGSAFPEATEERVGRLLSQGKLEDIYLLNFIGGKSWLRDGTYISVFASVNNVFDAVYRTGGYEQGRNGNFGRLWQDNLSGTPSFGPKYWYGYGRTYFINLAISF